MSETFKYFKTALPGNTLIIQATGKGVPVVEINPQLGVVMTKNDSIISAVEDQIRRGRGGWSTMTSTEYEEAVQKKSSHSSPAPWREEFGGRTLRLAQPTFGQPRRASVAGVGKPPPEAGSAPVQVPNPGPQPAPDAAPASFRPTATKRPN